MEKKYLQILGTVALFVFLVAVAWFIRPDEKHEYLTAHENLWDLFLPRTKSTADYCTERDAPALDWVRKLYELQFSSLESRCKNSQRIGSVGDGGKVVCTDGLQPEINHNCVVYSLGSNMDFSFELSAKKHFGCEIFTFDCTVGHVNHTSIPKDLKFFPWCVGGKAEKKTISSNFGHTGEIGQYYPLEHIMKMLSIGKTATDSTRFACSWPIT